MVESTEFDELAAELPDRPQWVEPRGLLLAKRCEVLLGAEGKRGAGYFVIETGRPLVCAVRRPTAALVERLRTRYPEHGQILLTTDIAAHLQSLLPGWHASYVSVHVHPKPEVLPSLRHPENKHPTRELGPGDAALLDGLAPDVRASLELALAQAPVVAAFDDDGVAAAFCTALYETETWWDVKMHTRPTHRRHGFASAAAAHLTRDQLAEGKKPVWGALEANPASLKLALKYGFRAVERLVLLERERPGPLPSAGK